MEILHVDVNSAYLSWTAVHLLEKGGTLDIRTVPAVIAGDPNLRQGIVLAKSIPAKKLGIQTGESLAEAKRKCEHLLIFPPEYDLYLDCSDSMYQILTGYSGRIQRYSVDECFLEYDGKYTPYDTAEQAAEAIKEQIKRELGFTVSIGISTNKVLAKMAGELKKPDGVSTIYPYEIEKKLWHLPVSDLFMVGHATKKKLEKMNIRTIGQLACCDVKLLRGVMKSHGQRIWEYANGKDYSGVVPNEEVFQKGIGNSTTFSYDITSEEEALQMLLAICERVSMRLRSHNWRAGLICIYVKTNKMCIRDRYTSEYR